MEQSFWALLEASPPAVMLRGSLWLYPAVNAGHILGIALLFGAIVPLDMRLLGLWSRVPLAPLLQVLRATAGCGALLGVICGFLLFITRAASYVDSTVFTAKMIVVGAGLLNALILQKVVPPSAPPPWVAENKVPPAVRLSAGLSLSAWFTALILGRLIGYVH